MAKIGIAGLGYAGICTGACFAGRGFDVVGIDASRDRIRALSNGELPMFERGLEEYLRRAISRKKFSFTTEYSALNDADYIFVTVGTPNRANGTIDLAQVRSASRSIGRLLPRMSEYPLIAVKSTVIPGTLRNVVKPILEKVSGKKAGLDFGLCSNPEFLREGSAIHDTLHPDKVVIGADDLRSRRKLSKLFAEFYGHGRLPIVYTDPSTAELIKYANNAFLAMKISYINTIARLCEGIEASDVKKVAEAIGLDARIGPGFLEAGPGYGGSCFPKDLRALISYSEQSGVEPSLFRATQAVNKAQGEHVVEIASRMLGNLEGRSVSILGLSFKAGTDDIRESAALKVITKLLQLRANIKVYDSNAIDNTRKIFGEKLQYARSAKDCLKDSELSIILTGWDEFTKLRPSDFSRLMRRARVLDARRIYDVKEFSGIEFAAIGLGE